MKKSENIIKGVIASVAMLSAIGVYAAPSMHVTPEPGEVAELSEFHLTFDGSWALEDRKAKFSVTGPEGVEIPPLVSYSLGEANGYMVGFEDDAVLTTPGKYTFTVPEGRFSVNGYIVGETVYEYEIVSGDIPEDPNVYSGAVTLQPKEGTYTSLSTIAVGFEGDVVEIVNPEGVSLRSNEMDVPISITANAGGLSIEVDNEDHELTTAGTYVLAIQSGSLSIDGKTNVYMAYRYEVAEPEGFPHYTMDPAPGAYDSLTGFTLKFSTEETVKLSKNSVFVMSDNGISIDVKAEVPTGMPYIVVTPVGDDGELKPIDVKGKYNLVFTSGGVQVGDNKNSEPLVFEYHVNGASGIDSITADKTRSEIYNLSGVKVEKDTNNLPNGVYIIDGKKHLIK